MSPPAIRIEGLSHRYGDQNALAGVGFDVAEGEVFGLLGPNGGGKTTLFRILATLLPVQQGQVELLGCDVAARPHDVRRLIGVTFQSPALDVRLTVHENLVHQSHLYGLSGRTMRERIDELLTSFGLTDRQRDRVASLSGGLQRRVEIAKGLLHGPRLLLLDEPSTGLDPAARLDMWRHLGRLAAENGVTVLVTTHLMEEADRCNRIGILDAGRLVALGAPAELRGTLGGDCLTIAGADPESLAARITERFGIAPRLHGDTLRIERGNGHLLLKELVEAFPDDVQSISLGKPTLEDVFIARTGHRFEEDDAS